jgi:iron(III) transport system permease protein
MELARRRGRLILLVVAMMVVVITFAMTSGSRERGLALNTIYLVAATCAISVPLGTLLAFLIARTDLPGRRALALIAAVLLFMPLYVQTAAWQAGFGQQGWFTLVVSPLGTSALLDGWRGATWIHALAAFPWVILIVGLALRLVEPQYEESALLDVSPARVVWHVTLPRALPAILVASVWVAVMTAGEITVTDMWQLRTYAEEVFIGFSLGNTLEETTLGVVPGVLVTSILMLAALAVCQRLMAGDFAPPRRAPWTFRLGAWRWPAALLVGLILLVLIGVPLGNLLVNLGMQVELASGERMHHWSAAKALANFVSSVWEFRRELGWSLVTAAAAATCSLALAILLAWPARRGGWIAWLVMIVIAICFATPGPFIGLTLSWLLNLPNRPLLNWLYDRSILAPTLALTIRALPLVMLVVYWALRSVPQRTLEAAALDGAGPWRRLFFIALPQRLAMLTGAWLVGLAVAMGDLSASFLVIPAGFSTLSRRIFEEVHYGVPDRIAGITLAAMAMMSAIALSAAWLLRTGRRH